MIILLIYIKNIHKKKSIVVNEIELKHWPFLFLVMNFGRVGVRGWGLWGVK